MKKLSAGLIVVVIALHAAGVSAQANKTKAKPQTKATQTDVLKRGAPIGKSEPVALADAIRDPRKFAGKTVTIEGVIVRSCKSAGCWMELAASAEARSLRVIFKDHKFFIPLDAQGMQAKAEGVFEIKHLSKETVDHLVNEDGAKIERNADGTATEITFIASGIELRKV